jgi:hypothetical protein
LLSRGHRLFTDSDTFSNADFNIQRMLLVLLSMLKKHSDSHPLKRKRAHAHFHAIKRSNYATNSLLPSLSSILKQRRWFHARSAGGYFSSTYLNRGRIMKSRILVTFKLMIVD